MEEVVGILEAILDKMYDIESQLQDINTKISTTYNLDDVHDKLLDIEGSVDLLTDNAYDIDDIYSKLEDIETSVDNIE